MIKAAVDFAKKDGHTLVVITADHETGDLYLDNGRYTFHSGSHTGNNVPLLVYGADDLFDRDGHQTEVHDRGRLVRGKKIVQRRQRRRFTVRLAALGFLLTQL